MYIKKTTTIEHLFDDDQACVRTVDCNSESRTLSTTCTDRKCKTKTSRYQFTDVRDAAGLIHKQLDSKLFRLSSEKRHLRVVGSLCGRNCVYLDGY